ncbi:hypothetical protein HOLleu_21420 [Holothuria leucospilota]|uniref:Uncharacterized protein n=1 Tax=Holothuria leucospilota TaxID=206669 RepID=A0A9Q1BXS1_HOLLE|nr:hypothetical protein HOLleu_21420 [Holothuria leucospilota]
MVSELQQSDDQQRFINESLPFISPADLHYVLRFSCGLYPPCSHLILRYLLNKCHPGEGSLPDYIMNCIFLCFVEYYGDVGTEILDVVSAVCKRHITIRSDDSRLLQHAKVSMFKIASDCGITVERIFLEDLVVSAAKDTLRFNSDVTMGAIDTVRVIEISRWDQTLKDEDYHNLLKFIANSTHLEKAW